MASVKMFKLSGVEHLHAVWENKVINTKSRKLKLNYKTETNL